MKQTPMLQQYLALKEEHPDSILFYRLGDFYELFFEDAERAAPILGLVLTQRRHNDEVTSPMCGVPHHAVAGYVGKLVEEGFRVALAEQIEDPAKAKGLVRRRVVRIFTPGTVTDPEMLADGERRHVACLVPSGDEAAVAYLEAASGDFGGAFGDVDLVRNLIAQLGPRELLLRENPPSIDGVWPIELGDPVVTERPAAWFSPARSEEVLRRCLNVGSLRAFEFDGCEPLIAAAGALLEYVRSTQGELPRHVHDFSRRRLQADLTLDVATIRNLEIVQDAAGGARGSLVRTLDRTVTSMGSRYIRDWLVGPAASHAVAEARHGAVAAFMESSATLNAVRELLRAIGDLERAAARIGFRQARPAELAGLRSGLAAIPSLRAALVDSPDALLAELARGIDELGDLLADLQANLADDPPALLGPGTIRSGVDAELDESRKLARGAKEVLGELEAKERARTGIGTLRIRYNRVFGYAFEVSRSNLAKVPEDFVRRQTLAGAERFTTAELVDLEHRIVAAEARGEEREAELFAALLDRCAECSGRLAATARAVATVDVLAGFAVKARERGYVRPRLVEGTHLRLRGSRHPVIEDLSKAPFVPNDLELDSAERQILILTGPNMGGKSTFLRQVALAVIMARAGSFVAADEAEIGEIDRIFTRVGAADDIARGESTFMVEMTEVANILRHATDRSLVVLDEVGRGTATFDGLSLAWAVVEALHDHSGGSTGPLVLFATHYHELTDLADRLQRVGNASLAVKEWQGQVLFLHRVVPGPSDRSYGIHVARLAGVPEPVCERAQKVLAQLERQELKVIEAARPAEAPTQLHLFPTAEDAVVQRLRRVDITETTPLEALNVLAELRRLVEGGE